MTVFVTEHYRPTKDLDQIFISVDNITYVKHANHDLKWLEDRILDYRNDDRSKIVMTKLDLTELSDIANDFVYHGHLEQPCNISIYAWQVTNIGSMWTSIRSILEHNLVK
jgi:hypothetical protein